MTFYPEFLPNYESMMEKSLKSDDGVGGSAGGSRFMSNFSSVSDMLRDFMKLQKQQLKVDLAKAKANKAKVDLGMDYDEEESQDSDGDGDRRRRRAKVMPPGQAATKGKKMQPGKSPERGATATTMSWLLSPDKKKSTSATETKAPSVAKSGKTENLLHQTEDFKNKASSIPGHADHLAFSAEALEEVLRRRVMAMMTRQKLLTTSPKSTRKRSWPGMSGKFMKKKKRRRQSWPGSVEGGPAKYFRRREQQSGSATPGGGRGGGDDSSAKFWQSWVDKFKSSGGKEGASQQGGSGTGDTGDTGGGTGGSNAAVSRNPWGEAKECNQPPATTTTTTTQRPQPSPSSSSSQQQQGSPNNQRRRQLFPMMTKHGSVSVKSQQSPAGDSSSSNIPNLSFFLNPTTAAATTTTTTTTTMATPRPTPTPRQDFPHRQPQPYVLSVPLQPRPPQLPGPLIPCSHLRPFALRISEEGDAAFPATAGQSPGPFSASPSAAFGPSATEIMYAKTPTSGGRFRMVQLSASPPKATFGTFLRTKEDGAGNFFGPVPVVAGSRSKRQAAGASALLFCMVWLTYYT